jgi:4-amino-4-deoxy-L-arabinose transferase-like glycosyltransferase
LLTLLFLCVLVQPLLACTLIYGLIPALSLSLWAIYFAVRFMQTGSKREIIWIALFCAAAVYMKPNAWIFVVSIAIALALTAMRKRRWTPLIAAVIAVIVCVPLPKIAQKAYETRIGVGFGEGYPMSSWMAMGMQESWMASGWYNGYSQEMYKTYGKDIEAIKQRNAQDISQRLDIFAEDPDYAYWFYQDKFSSQWNEATFESIWVSTVCETYGERSILAKSMYDGRWPGVVYEKAMDYALQLIYAGFLLSTFIMLKKRKTEQLVFPIAILGGILFHLLFEANVKYALSYLPLFAPLAAYGILAFGFNATKWFTRDGAQARKGAL